MEKGTTRQTILQNVVKGALEIGNIEAQAVVPSSDMASKLFSFLAKRRTQSFPLHLLAKNKVNIPYHNPVHCSEKLTKCNSAALALAAVSAMGLFLANKYNDLSTLHASIQLPKNLYHSLVDITRHPECCMHASLFNAFANSSPSSPCYFQAESHNSSSSTPNDNPQCLTRHSIADAAAKVSPAVVNLTVTQGIPGVVMGKAFGSGTIIDPKGLILTNAHLVSAVASTGISPKAKVLVTLQDGRTFDAEVLNIDVHNDIALVRVSSKSELPSAKLGSSSKLRAGDWVIALGSPLFLKNTVTAGIISCVDRKSSDLGLTGAWRDYLQTDCAINEGNSGGPLVNLDGEVIGVNSFKVAAAAGMGFAIPIDSVSKIVEQFKKHGRVIRPWLGLKMLDLNKFTISDLKDKDATFPDINEGVLVPLVTPGSPADRAGFRTGDVVVQFDRKPVKSTKEIVEVLGDRVGVPIKVTVMRANNKQVELTIVPEEASRNL